MLDSRPIRSEKFADVTVDHLRALMQRLVFRYSKGWASTNGERLGGLFEERQVTGFDRTVDVMPPTRGSWAVGLLPSSPGLIKCWASIEAYELPGYTQVDFWDGYYPGTPRVEHTPVGAAFEEFCEMLVSEVAALTPTEGKAALDMEHLSTSERYVFRKSAEVWEIAYEGSKFHLSHVKGLAYIACLLRSPRNGFHVLELSAAVEKNLPSDAAALYARMTKEQLAEEGLSVSRGGEFDDILDEQAKKEYGERLQTIAEEREIAEQIGDTAKVEELDRGVGLIERELRTSQGLFGRKRKLGSSDEEKARSNIQQLIKLALQKVQEHDSALFDHLNSSITTGYHCVYKPKTPIAWSL